MTQEYFDIERLAKLLIEQAPKQVDLIAEVKALAPLKFIRAKYVTFVDRSLPDQSGTEWQFAENIVLEDPQEGTLIIDVLKNGRLGGIEFYALLD